MLTRLVAVMVAAVMILPLIASDADARPRTKRTYSTSSSASHGQHRAHRSAKRGPRHASHSRARNRVTRSSRRSSRSYRSSERMSLGYSSYASSRRSGVGGRPRRWCGWWMRTQRGGGPAYNLAWNWRNYGRPASPQVGAVVVWRHHVGQIVGQSANGRWLVQSGNDGGAVRTRARSIAGAVIRM